MGQCLKVEIAKNQYSFSLLAKMIKKWVADEPQSSRFMHGDPSGHPESIFEVQKLQDGRKWAETGRQSCQKS